MRGPLSHLCGGAWGRKPRELSKGMVKGMSEGFMQSPVGTTWFENPLPYDNSYQLVSNTFRGHLVCKSLTSCTPTTLWQLISTLHPPTTHPSSNQPPAQPNPAQPSPVEPNPAQHIHSPSPSPSPHQSLSLACCRHSCARDAPDYIKPGHRYLDITPLQAQLLARDAKISALTQQQQRDFLLTRRQLLGGAKSPNL